MNLEGGRDEEEEYYQLVEMRRSVESVLHLLNKQSPLTLKQEQYCSKECVERFVRAKGNSVKKAAKHLRNCLSWRDSLPTEDLMADEFSAELAEGVAYVAGHDHELRPVLHLSKSTTCRWHHQYPPPPLTAARHFFLYLPPKFRWFLVKICVVQSGGRPPVLRRRFAAESSPCRCFYAANTVAVRRKICFVTPPSSLLF